MFSNYSMSPSEFIKLTRPRTLTAAISPVVLGLAYGSTYYEPGNDLWFVIVTEAMLFAIVILAQMATNMWNEYYDFKSGLDLQQIIGNSGSIVKGKVSPKKIKDLSIIVIGTAISMGIILSFLVSIWLLPVGFLAIAVAYSYSGGPYPISRTPFGEFASGIAMGLTIVLVAAYLWVGSLHWDMLIPAIPSMVLIGLILQTNSTRDMVNDELHGRKTLAILLGRDNSIYVMTGAYFFVQLWLIFWIFTHHLYSSAALGLLSAFFSGRAVKIFLRYSDVVKMDEAMKYAALANTSYHFLFAIGLWLHPYL